MYQYQGNCYQNESSALTAVCGRAPFLTADGHGISCLVSGNQVQITKHDFTGTYTFAFQPSFQDCAIEPSFLTQFDSTIISLLFAAFIGLLMRRAL